MDIPVKDFLKAILYNPKLWRVLLISVLTFLGYNEAVRYIETTETVEVQPVEVKATKAQKEHSHKQHSHKNWLPTIQNEIKKAKEAHNDNHHGGN